MYKSIDIFDPDLAVGAVNAGVNYFPQLSTSLDTVRTDKVQAATNTTASYSSFGNNVVSSLGLSGIMTWLKANPLPSIGIAVAVFFLLKKLLKF